MKTLLTCRRPILPLPADFSAQRATHALSLHNMTAAKTEAKVYCISPRMARAPAKTTDVNITYNKKPSILSQPGHRRTVVESLIYGSLSSAISTVIFQPLELLKTRIQIQHGSVAQSTFFGRATSSAALLAKQNGISYLWTGTAPVSALTDTASSPLMLNLLTKSMKRLVSSKIDSRSWHILRLA